MVKRDPCKILYLKNGRDSISELDKAYCDVRIQIIKSGMIQYHHRTFLSSVILKDIQIKT